jgi:hypothetical protein
MRLFLDNDWMHVKPFYPDAIKRYLREQDKEMLNYYKLLRLTKNIVIEHIHI